MPDPDQEEQDAAARRLAEIDQARAATVDLAERVALHFTTLVKNGVPEGEAVWLSREFQEVLFDAADDD